MFRRSKTVGGIDRATHVVLSSRDQCVPHLDRRPRTIKTGLTETEAQAQCERKDTRQAGVYFDGYDYMKGTKP